MGLPAAQGVRLNPPSLGPITLFLSSCLLTRYEKRPFCIWHLCQHGHFHRPLFIVIVPNSPHSHSPPLDLPPNITCTLYVSISFWAPSFKTTSGPSQHEWGIFLPTTLTHSLSWESPALSGHRWCHSTNSHNWSQSKNAWNTLSTCSRQLMF